MWLRLAWIEWQRSLTGRPNRDFLWLTVLLTLTLSLAILGWGSQRGLLDKFVDVSIGRLEGAGIPIWVAANTSAGITRDTLESKTLKLHPYVEVEPKDIALPGALTDAQQKTPIWNNNGDSKIIFEGWAVHSSDPLLKGTPWEQNATPLVIVLNRSLFKKYFDCSAYTEVLKKQLPFLTLPNPQQNSLYCLSNDILWLDAYVGAHRELLPFKISWQEHLQTVQDIAFLFPLSTFYTLKLKRFSPYLEYHPMQKTLISELLWQDNNEIPDTLIQQWKSCFSASQVNGNRIIINPAIPREWVTLCARQYNIPLQENAEQQLEEPYLQITNEIFYPHYEFKYQDNDYLDIRCIKDVTCSPCQKSPALKTMLSQSEAKALNCSENSAKIDMIEVTGNYQNSFVYVENRSLLVSQVENIKQFKKDGTNVFLLPITYEDSLIRFMFIDKIMDILKKLYSPFFMIFISILLWVQVNIVIAHRKHNYAIFLAKGMSWKEIQLIVFTQVTLSFSIAIFMSYWIIEVMKYMLATDLSSVTVSEPYIDHISSHNLNLLPLQLIDYIWIGGIGLLCLICVTLLVLNRSVYAYHSEPAYLFE